MKKLAFSALFFSAIVWLICVKMIAADGSLANVSGTTVAGGAVPGGSSSVLSTSNGISASGRVYVSTNGTEFLGTNYTGAIVIGGIYGTNVFCVDVPASPRALNVDTNGGVFTTGVMTVNGVAFTGGIGGAGRFLFGSITGLYMNPGSVLEINKDTVFGWAGTGNCTDATDTTLARTSAGTVTVTTNLIAKGDIVSTNGHGWAMSATPVYLTNIVYTNVTLDFGSTATLSFSDLLVNAQNLKSNDIPVIAPPAISMTNGVFTAWVSNTTLYARYNNYAATAINPASGIFNIQVFQYR